MTRFHIQETIFPDRHTVAVMNPATGEFLPVAEIQDTDQLRFIDYPAGRFRQVVPGNSRAGLRSGYGEDLQHFAAMVAKFYSPFERLRPSDYTGSLFD
jgi:hypothetical protein